MIRSMLGAFVALAMLAAMPAQATQFDDSVCEIDQPDGGPPLAGAIDILPAVAQPSVVSTADAPVLDCEQVAVPATVPAPTDEVLAELQLIGGPAEPNPGGPLERLDEHALRPGSSEPVLDWMSRRFDTSKHRWSRRAVASNLRPVIPRG